MHLSITVDNKTNKLIRCQHESIESKLKDYLKELDKELDYDVYIVFQFNLNRNVAITKGYYSKKIQDLHGKIPHSIFFKKNPNYLFNDLIESKDIIEYSHEDNSRCLFDGIKRGVYIPIFSSRDKVMELIGCLYLGSYREADIDFETLSEKIKVYEYVSNISYLLDNSITKEKAIYNMINTIHILLMILEKKDSTLFSHSYNVGNWCKELANEINLDESEIKKLYIAGLLHDVGKAFIDDSIINKRGKLTDEEYEEVKKHSLYSYNISKKILAEHTDLHGLPKIIKYHHERYDGKGYPEGLKKEEIPFYSFILSIADSVDAMLSQRPYKKSFGIEKVIKELHINKGKQFHPELVDIMIKMLSNVQREYICLTHNHLNFCYLIINYEEEVDILEGILSKYEDYYIFSPNDEIEASKIDPKDIISAEMAIKDSTNLFDYDVKIEDFKNNEFYISSIELMDSPNSFNLLWDLEGMLYIPEDNGKVFVNISQIGGDCLRFYLEESKESNIIKQFINKPLRLDIKFTDYVVDVTGIIIKTHKLGHKQYCGFQYTDIPDFKRDKIFRQLFKKQIEVRKMISNIEFK